MDTFARLHKAIEYLKDIGKVHIQRDIVNALDGNESNIAQALKGNPRYLTKPFLKRFAGAYSDYINEEWLLTGEGEMELPSKELRPHVEAGAAAGSMIGISEGEYGNDMRQIIPGLPDYDFTIYAEGRSMEPRIESGDLLACRIVRDRQNPPVGKICVIDSRDGWAVKVIKKIDEDSVVLHSLNPEYADYSVDAEDILNVAVVVGMVSVFD